MMPDHPNLRPCLVALLSAAANALRPKDVAPYMELRAFIISDRSGDKSEFIHAFSKYYRLNNGGLGARLKAAYFEHLFAYETSGSSDPYTSLLLALYNIPNAHGLNSLVASFASKLVAINDESQPLYDKHVAAFFGIKLPGVGPIESRISQLVLNLQEIKTTYDSWTQVPEVIAIIDRVKLAYPGLVHCHPNRICDFLVWSVGSHLKPEKSVMSITD